MRYILGFIIGLGLIILLFVAIFHHGNSTNAPAPNTTHQMVDYANTSTEVQFTDDYPVNANQVHRETITTVGRDQVTFSVVSGYENQVIRTQSYVNNSAAYAEFLRALQIAGYTLKNDDSKLRDERGYCPTGHRYIYEIKDGSNTSQHTWSTSCGNIGNFKGRSGTINDLFHRQVPDYGKLTEDIGLYF